MKLSAENINRYPTIVLKEVFNGIRLVTEEGNVLNVCMRDDTFEINIKPAGEQKVRWFRVDMSDKTILPFSDGREGSKGFTPGVQWKFWSG